MSLLDQILEADEQLLRYINGNLALEYGSLQPVMVLFTLLGHVLVLLIIAAPFMWRYGKRKEILVIVLAGIATNFIAAATKYAIDRPRPPDTEVLVLISNVPAFPSGHAANAFVVCTMLALIYKKKWPYLIALASLIALSRVWLGAHYPSDIIAGALLGALVGLTIFYICKRPKIDEKLDEAVARMESYLGKGKEVSQSEGPED